MREDKRDTRLVGREKKKNRYQVRGAEVYLKQYTWVRRDMMVGASRIALCTLRQKMQ